ncbi:unnamed protein product [Adineta ricciae]|uniref:G-protein coupled receptors family 1 profile domain-containing protein n=1 Tax=Adineta ricciae TaxID=249248 RepID=A0A815R4U7_ADIRI|nr:unnamed protein product [Adineta ricciae]
MSNTTAVSTQADLINQIYRYNQIFTRYTLGFALTMGNFVSILDILVFSQAHMRKNTCSMYFIACAISELFTFNVGDSTRMLNFGYKISIYNMFDWLCRVRYYITFAFVAIPHYFIILASIDRYFASSRNARRRQWSSPRIARRLIIGNILLWLVVYSHCLIFYTNQTGQCSTYDYAYDWFLRIQDAICAAFLPLLLMCIFGWLTLKNIRAIGKQIRPNEDVHTLNTMSRKDFQLIKLLIYQVAVFSLLFMPQPCFFIYDLSTYYTPKSPIRVAIEFFINNAVHCLVYIKFSCTILINLSISKLFRVELYRLIQTKIFRQKRQHAVIIATHRGTEHH